MTISLTVDISCFTHILLFATLPTSLPGSSVHGILQEGILESITISFSRGSFPPRDRTSASCSSYSAGGFFTAEPLEKPHSLTTQASFQFLSLCLRGRKRKVRMANEGHMILYCELGGERACLDAGATHPAPWPTGYHHSWPQHFHLWMRGLALLILRSSSTLLPMTVAEPTLRRLESPIFGYSSHLYHLTDLILVLHV